MEKTPSLCAKVVHAVNKCTCGSPLMFLKEGKKLTYLTGLLPGRSERCAQVHFASRVHAVKSHISVKLLYGAGLLPGPHASP